jgi:PIN domain nuclease of toxin-antitoxin system
VTEVLADTHAVVWALYDPGRLTARALALFEDASVMVGVSVASLWEIAIKASVGKLEVPDDLPGAVTAAGFEIVPVTAADVWAVRALPLHHRDPFDRVLVAQALHADADLVSIDAHFDAYGVRRLW